MLSTFSKDKLSARKGCWKQFPTFGQGDVFVLPLSHAFVPRCAESIPCPVPFSVPAHLYCTSLQSLSWSWPSEVSFYHVVFCESSSPLQRANSLTPVGEMTDGNSGVCLHEGCKWLHLHQGSAWHQQCNRRYGANQQQERCWKPRLTTFVKLTKVNKPLFPINCPPMMHTLLLL